MRIFFATNRDPIGNPESPQDFGIKFSPNGLQDLRFGFCEAEHFDQFEEGVFKVHTTPQKDDSGKLGSQVVFENVKQIMKRGKDTLIFVHGYNTDFKSAISMAATLKRNFAKNGKDLNIITFTWPSDGSNIYHHYGSDRHDAEASGHAFARGILKLRDFLAQGDPCGQRVHLMCHSMGNYVLRYTLQAMKRIEGGALPQLFDNIFLMAADEDHDAFEHDHKLAQLPDLGHEVFVYFNRHDKALWGSDKTKGNPTRLGSSGPRLPHMLDSKITVVDCSRVALSGILEIRHNYLANNDRVTTHLSCTIDNIEMSHIAGNEFDVSKNKWIILKLK